LQVGEWTRGDKPIAIAQERRREDDFYEAFISKINYLHIFHFYY